MVLTDPEVETVFLSSPAGATTFLGAFFHLRLLFIIIFVVIGDGMRLRSYQRYLPTRQP